MHNRERLWCNVVAGMASAFNVRSIDTAVRWADEAVKAYNQSFNAMEPIEKNNSDKGKWLSTAPFILSFQTIPGLTY